MKRHFYYTLPLLFLVIFFQNFTFQGLDQRSMTGTQSDSGTYDFELDESIDLDGWLQISNNQRVPASLNQNQDREVQIPESEPIDSNLRRRLSQTIPRQEGYDIILVAGQSNAVGKGLGTPVEPLALARMQETPNTPCKRVCQLGRKGVNGHTQVHDLQVIPAVEPLDHFKTGTHGFALTFAKRLAMQLPPHRKVLIIPAAKGGTSILYWDKQVLELETTRSFYEDKNLLYRDMIYRTNYAINMSGKRNRLVAVLWQQGEADIAVAQLPNHFLHPYMRNARDYSRRLTRLHRNIRNDVVQKTCYPILMGLPSPSWHKPVHKDEFIEAITAVSENEPCSGVVSSRGLTANNTIQGYDTVHYNAQSQIELGRRYFEFFIRNYW